MFKKKNQEKTTFKQDGVKLNKCPCGSGKLGYIPAGFDTDGLRLVKAICCSCGEIIPGEPSRHRSTHVHAKAWNDHMELRQAQEGGHINDTTSNEET